MLMPSGPTSFRLVYSSKRTRVVRQQKGICRRRSPVAWQRGGTRGKRIEDTSQTGLAPAGCASVSSSVRVQKQQLLEDFVTATGYVHKYALWLLNHAEEVLVLAWKTLNRICAKRLIPFLPDPLERLEEEGHVQLSQEHRSLLLSMSSADKGTRISDLIPRSSSCHRLQLLVY